MAESGLLPSETGINNRLALPQMEEGCQATTSATVSLRYHGAPTKIGHEY